MECNSVGSITTALTPSASRRFTCVSFTASGLRSRRSYAHLSISCRSALRLFLIQVFTHGRNASRRVIARHRLAGHFVPILFNAATADSGHIVYRADFSSLLLFSDGWYRWQALLVGERHYLWGHLITQMPILQMRVAML